jgi:hypothetical protein
LYLCTSSLNHGNDQLGFDTVNHGDEQLGFDVLRGTSGDQSYNPSAPWEELVKHTVYEKPLGHEYSTAASISDPILQKSHWEAPSLPLKQPGLQSGSHSSFPGELVNKKNKILLKNSYNIIIDEILRKQTLQSLSYIEMH